MFTLGGTSRKVQVLYQEQKVPQSTAHRCYKGGKQPGPFGTEGLWGNCSIKKSAIGAQKSAERKKKTKPRRGEEPRHSQKKKVSRSFTS